MNKMTSFSDTVPLKLDVSVIIPTYNEEKFISKCLSSILNQDYPKEKFEIIVVDGMSTDATCKIVERYMQFHSNIRLTQNESRFTSTAMNIGIHLASSQVIMRMDGHAEAPRNYISQSVDCLVNKKTDAVGCLMETIGGGYWGQRIALALSSPFGVGNARYRVSNVELHGEPGWLGTFWRNSLLNLGGYNEFYQCNEDCELSYRMLFKGYSLYTPSNVSCKYYCRTTLRGLWQQYYKYGFWKVALISNLRKIPSIRHVIPAFFFMTLSLLALAALFSPMALKTLLITVLAYTAFTLVGSWKASKSKNIRCFWTITPVFIVLHFSYGIGFLKGIFSLVKDEAKNVKKTVDLKNLKQFLRPILQNKLASFAIYCIDAIYDFARYLLYSGNLYAVHSDRTKLESLILMHTHKIEKALALKEPREIEAVQITRLVRYMERYSKNGDRNSIPILSACVALSKYTEYFGFKLHKHSSRVAKSLHAFLMNYAEQIEENRIQSGTKTYQARSAAEKNTTIDYDFFVRSRHSIRNFSNTPVPREVLNRAVDQAKYTPSVCNRQSWRVHVFENEIEKKKALSVQNGNEGFGDSADKILLITCDMRCFFTSRERNQYFIDGGMFSMSLIHALHAAGVGSCALNLSTYSYQDFKLHRLLGIPGYEAPIMMMAIGYPPDNLEVACSHRIPVQRLIRYRDS
jgi:glycosyltransferase involved in cell wall biosynthesis/nitroreductase